MLEIDILRNSSQNILGVLKGDFWGFECPNDTQMPFWRRLWFVRHMMPLYPAGWDPFPCSAFAIPVVYSVINMAVLYISEDRSETEKDHYQNQ